MASNYKYVLSSGFLDDIADEDFDDDFEVAVETTRGDYFIPVAEQAYTIVWTYIIKLI